MKIDWTVRRLAGLARRKHLSCLLVGGLLVAGIAGCGGGGGGFGFDGKRIVRGLGRLIAWADSTNAVAFGDGRFVLLDFFGAHESVDGTRFTRVPGFEDGLPGLRGLAFGDAGWVAAVSSGHTFYSQDGRAWSSIQIAADPQDAPALVGVAFGAGRYVVVGEGGSIFLSHGGWTWDEASSGTASHLLAVAHANDQFVAVGQDGTIVRSGDGLTWQLEHWRSESLLLGVAGGDGVWLATGGGGLLLRSVDGAAWEEIPIPVEDFFGVGPLWDAAFGLGRFVVVGRDAMSQGVLLVSSDGAQSFERVRPGDGTLGSFAGLDSITFGRGRFVAVGHVTTVTSSDGIVWEEHSRFR